VRGLDRERQTLVIVGLERRDGHLVGLAGFGGRGAERFWFDVPGAPVRSATGGGERDGQQRSDPGVHQSEILPSTRGPAAPVTRGTLPGAPNSVWLASTANAIASLASGSTPSADVVVTGTGASRSARWRISVGFSAPPPDTNTSSGIAGSISR